MTADVARSSRSENVPAPIAAPSAACSVNVASPATPLRSDNERGLWGDTKASVRAIASAASSYRASFASASSVHQHLALGP